MNQLVLGETPVGCLFCATVAARAATNPPIGTPWTRTVEAIHAKHLRLVHGRTS